MMLLSLLLLASASPTAAHADWQGDMHLTVPPRGKAPGPTEMSGKVQGTSTALRMDVDTGPMGSMSIITDWKKHKVWNLMHARKMYMESSMDRVGVHIPSCNADNIDSCLTKEGFIKSGSEQANGHSCAVYEKDATTRAGATHVKLWHPTDLKGVPLVRSTSADASGKTSQVDFTNVSVVAGLDPSLFAPPADYKAAGMMTMPPGGTMTPEQAAKLRQQYMKQYGQPAGQ